MYYPHVKKKSEIIITIHLYSSIRVGFNTLELPQKRLIDGKMVCRRRLRVVQRRSFFTFPLRSTHNRRNDDKDNEKTRFDKIKTIM